MTKVPEPDGVVPKSMGEVLTAILVDRKHHELECGCCVRMRGDTLRATIMEISLLIAYREAVRKIIAGEGYDLKLPKEEQIKTITSAVDDLIRISLEDYTAAAIKRWEGSTNDRGSKPEDKIPRVNF